MSCKIKRIVSAFLVLFLMLGFLLTDNIHTYAGTYDNAYSFYNIYGNRMCFVASSDTDGNIYYATRAKRTSSSILFSNIGWKATVQDANGTVLQEIYYKMNGSYLKTTDIRIAEDGYEYALYAVSLSTFKSRLNASTLSALESGNCNVTFDACIIIKRDGIPGGGMTDQGPSWGTVYNTYNGIVNAEQWSSTTQTSLLSYFDKEVEGLFYTLTINKDNGIDSVNGGGTYCYGTVVTISAIPKAGYEFVQWTGYTISSSVNTNVTITKNLTYKANSKRENLTVTFYRNWNAGDTTTGNQVYIWGTEGQNLQNFGWTKTGYYQTGWKHNREGLGTDYTITNPVSTSWINSYIPSLTLYGSWSPNRYTIHFDMNVEGEDTSEFMIQERAVNYEATMQLPICGYVHQKATFLGWSLKADDILPQFYALESIAVADLAQECGVENSDGAQITLYAIWDKIPAINVADIYVSLENAQNGKVTEGWLAAFASAGDMEDGEISYGTHENNSFLLKTYDSTRYTKASEEGFVMETFSVTDSSGNICNRTICVYLVDTKVHSGTEVYGNVRFISEEYLMDEDGNLLSEEEGGLCKDSVWRWDNTLLELLKQILVEAR